MKWRSTMKKRIMALLVALTMVVVAVGCGKGYKVGENGEVYNDYVKIKKWKELEVERVDPIPVTDEDVNLSIESDLQTLTSYVEIKDRGAQNGDQVTIGFVGTLDGVAFEGGTGSDQFILGEGSFVSGFQEGIVGHKAGEEFDVPLTFPDNYGGDLGGKAVVFTMTLNKVEEVVVPELTDETAKQLNPKAKDVEEYKKLMRADLEKNNKEAAEAEMRVSALTVFMEQCEVIEYPKERLEEAIEYWTEFYTEQLEQMATMYYQMSLEELKESSGMSTEELLGASFEDIAKEQLKSEMALELFAKVEKIEYTDEAYEEFLEEQAELHGYEDGAAVEKDYEDMYGEGTCQMYCLQEKASALLFEHCVVVEPKDTETETETGTETESQDETGSEETVTE